MRDMIKPTLSLMIICFIVTLSLAFVNNLTKEQISIRIESDTQEQRKAVLKEAETFKEIENIKETDSSHLLSKAYRAFKGNMLVGYIFNAVPKGYAGEIKVTIGINKEGIISGVLMGDNQETPGLGTKAKDAAFINQYNIKSISKILQIVKRSPSSEDEIQAISGATITSSAINRAVNAASEMTKKIISNGEGKT